MAELITKERALLHLQAWLDAELAVSTGQSYSINGRSLTRANIAEIRKQIAYWEDRIAKINKTKRKSMRYVPRDL